MSLSDPLLSKTKEEDPSFDSGDPDGEDEEDKSQRRVKLIGISCSLVGAACFALRNFTTSVQTNSLDPVFVAFLERVSTVPFGAFCFSLRGSLPDKRDFICTLYLIASGFLVGSMELILIWTYSHIAVGDAVAASSITPASTGIMAWLILGERFTCREFAFASVGLAGVFVVSKPTILFELTDSDVDKGTLILGTLVAASTCFIRSTNQIIYRYVGRYDIKPSFSVFVVTLFSVVIPLVVCSVSNNWGLPDTKQLFLSIFAGAQGLMGALLAAEALFRIKAAHHSLIQLAVPIITYVLDIVFQGTILDWQSVVGCALIIAGSAAITEKSDGNERSENKNGSSEMKTVSECSKQCNQYQSEKD